MKCVVANLLLILSLAGCGGQERGVTDGGLDALFDGEGDGSDAVSRHLVAGTKGFCSTSGAVDDSCSDVSDCVGYRVPFVLDCCQQRPEHPVLNPSGCAFANRAAFVEAPDCTADESCLRAPRACVDGRCSEVVPDLQCETDSDCQLIDTGCQCLAISSSIREFAPTYGQACGGLTACPQEARAVCIAGSCVVSGPFLDQQVMDYCELCDFLGGFERTTQQCIDDMLDDDRAQAASLWFILESVRLAETCQGLLNGPLTKFIECLSVLCP